MNNSNAEAQPGQRLLRLSKDSWLAIGLFFLLALISAISIYQQTKEQEPPYLASSSYQPNGAKALWLWLESLGYPLSDKTTATFAIPDGTNLLLLLEPTMLIEPSEWAILDDWVAAGGTLLIAGNRAVANSAFAHFDFAVNWRPATVLELKQQTPLMISPPAAPLIVAANSSTLRTSRDDFVTHFVLGNEPVVVSFSQGNGRILLTTLTTPLTNQGLQQAGSPEFVLNLMSAAGEPGLIWFDEWHHGVRPQTRQIAGFGDWLRRAPLGRAFVFIGVVVFVALLLQGRPFGRPVPLPQETSRRAPLEYIMALANLSRRAGHRTAVMQDYHQRLKRSIGQRYRLNPTLPDEEFLAQLAHYNPTIDQDALRALLQRLAAPTISESEMVQLASEVSEWLAK